MSVDDSQTLSVNSSYVLLEWTRTKKIKISANSLQELIKFAKIWLNYSQNSCIKIVLEEDGKFLSNYFQMGR